MNPKNGCLFHKLGFFVHKKYKFNLPRTTLVIAAAVTLDAIKINNLSGWNVLFSIYCVKQAINEVKNPTTILWSWKNLRTLKYLTKLKFIFTNFKARFPNIAFVAVFLSCTSFKFTWDRILLKV